MNSAICMFLFFGLYPIMIEIKGDVKGGRG